MGPMILVAFVIVYIGYHYIDPAPPKHIVISAGDPAGNYYAAAKQYQELIKPEGIDLEILTSKGAWENLHRMEDPKSGVDIGFVQDGLGSRQKFPDVSSLGSMFYEPVWIFYRGKKDLNRLSQLSDFRIAVGESGGEIHTMAKKLLNASGITETNSHWMEMKEGEESEALQSGKVDAAFFVASANSPAIQSLIKDPNLRLMSLDQAEAMTRQFPYLHHVVLPHGTVDLGLNIPNKDIDLVAATATLVTRNSIHPALVYLLLRAAQKVHRQPGIFEKKSEFPFDKDFVFPVNAGAKEFFKSGVPFWIKYLPFWLATLMERFIFLILPAAAIVIPMLKLIPRYLNWRIRSRIYKGYGELKLLEDQISPDAKSGKIAEYVERLEVIENRVNQMNFPLDVFDDVYLLREHIHFVRERLNRMGEKPAKTDATA